MNYQDQIGKTYWKLTIKEVFKVQPEWKRARLYAQCECDCGEIHEARLDWLKNWLVKSCGCSHQTYLEQIGKTYGLLTIMDFHSKRSPSTWKMVTYAICDCACGKIDCAIQLPNLKSWSTKSCGCIRRQKTCGLTSNSRQYKTRYRMYNSCYNENHPSYKRRGGKGIKVCKERHTFAWWWKDNKHHYDKYAYFTRKNPFKDFNKENCVWHVAYNVSRFDLFEE